MATYARMGLPGAIGSIDAVFEAWNKVPKEMHNMCDGDKGMGVLFEVIVTHEKLILAVGGPYGSTINNKISVKYSEFLGAMKGKLSSKDIKNKNSDVLIYPQSITKLLIFITFYIYINTNTNRIIMFYLISI